MREFDVAVIGAGPAGSATAISLASVGHRVVLLDRARFPRDKLCGDFLNPISWPVLEDLGVADAVRECVHVKVLRFRVSAASGESAGSPLPLRDTLHSGLGIQRYFLDDVLVTRAKRLGVTVAEGCNVFGISREKGGWIVSYRGPHGNENRRARLLVGADGRNSRIARQLKLDAIGTQNHGSIGFQIRLEMISGLEDSVQVHQFPGGYAGLVRLDAETVNLCFTLDQSSAGKAISFDLLRKDFLNRNP
ncbi:MAG: NAD(P)/FAD-dependent oxidoreductase, partial [Candidatus Binatia bacterium]